MNRTHLIVIALAVPVALFGCGDDSGRGDTGTASDTSVATDTSVPDVSTDAPADTNTSACSLPEAPYGTEIGRNFEPFTLNDCGGNPYEFYGDEFCDSSFTVVSIAAGWCGPCIAESRVLESAITNRYGPSGVRVIQIITQTETYGPPDDAYCQGWVDTYGLSNVELTDPAQITGIYFPGNALPAALIVDSAGVIRFREYGYSGSMLGTLSAELDTLLAE